MCEILSTLGYECILRDFRSTESMFGLQEN